MSKLSKYFIRLSVVVVLIAGAVVSFDMIFPKNNSFIFVDLDGDGIERISLENSNAFFDVDGDGLAERTEWIGPNDLLLAIWTWDEMARLDSFGRVFAYYTNGIDMIKNFDWDQNNVLDEGELRGLSPVFSFDRNSDGLPETAEQDSYGCAVEKIKFSDHHVVAFCSNGKQLKGDIVTLKYEDSNIVWRALCDKIQASLQGQETFEKYCLLRK